MYHCKNCNIFFGDYEIKKIESCKIDYHGATISMYDNVCPICHGKLDDANSCEICGSPCDEGELTCGVCDECIDSYRYDFDKCYNISIGESSSVEINALVASVLDPGDINQILVEYIRKNIPDIDCSNFIDEDKTWFAERILKEKIVKENNRKWTKEKKK